jgi:ribosomal protein S18 acetylase RimI-like enzyme
MSIIIREAQEFDVPVIAELFDLYRQFYAQAADLHLSLEFISNRFYNRESKIIVAEQANISLIGFCQLYPTFCSVEAKPIYVLYDLFITPSFRKNGVGRMLLESAEQKAIADGKSRMDLTTAKTNKAAQSVYESLGWVRDEIFFAYSRNLPAN